MRKRLPRLCFLLILLTFSQCKKETLPVDAIRQINLGTDLSLRDIQFLEDGSAFICGGEAGTEGDIWKSTDGGENWTLIYTLSGRCIYDLDFYGLNHAYAGGDDLLLLHTEDGGSTWNNAFEDQDFSNWQEFIKPIRKVVYQDAAHIYTVGGDTWYKGLMCYSNNWGENWTYKDFDNQLNTIKVVDNQHIWASGYGMVLFSGDSCNTLLTLNFREDYFTGMDFSDTQSGLLCGYNGGIYKSSDGGQTWNEVLKSNGTFGNRRHLNNILILPDGRACAVGNSGLILISDNDWTDWTELDCTITVDLLSISAPFANTLWVCGTSGGLFQITL